MSFLFFINGTGFSNISHHPGSPIITIQQYSPIMTKVTISNTKHDPAANRKIVAFRPFPCRSCSKSFSTLFNLKRHERKFHQNASALTCPFKECHTPISQWEDLLQHLWNGHGKEIPWQTPTLTTDSGEESRVLPCDCQVSS